MKIVILAGATGGKVNKMTAELMGLGNRLAEMTKGEIYVALLGAQQAEEVAGELIHLGAQKVYLFSEEVLDIYQADLYSQVLDTLIREIDPDTLLFGHDIIGRELAPKLAIRIGAGCCMDCMDVVYNPEEDRFSGIHPVYGGNVINFLTSRRRPFLFTIRSRCQEPAEADQARTGEIIKVNISLDGIRQRTRIVGYSKSEGGELRLEDARVIVSGGRGLGGPEGFVILKELASVLGGAVGASRAAVDAGWIEASRQVGLTGKFVSPHLYVAVGISGAPQHMTGCAASKTIVCVNTNPEAPIFKRAHYGVVGDYKLIIPKIIPEFKKILNN
jgi:electron transfer flavoprotein alpha subunit